MENNKKGKRLGLVAKTAAIFGAALAAITGMSAEAPTVSEFENTNSNTISLRTTGKTKPMPVLKLNLATGDNHFVASHSSHRSHSSHSSHSSHRSHYSSSRFS
ncbi:hypothetical protein [Botryobacter ruber]|uniref:hypothetical protein n=1 Tax=Botryobacter ruber TaxID=2171629 RepID=UPI000F64EE50|nr:hypothetical protein [Botryobacter ruber]